MRSALAAADRQGRPLRLGVTWTGSGPVTVESLCLLLLLLLLLSFVVEGLAGIHPEVIRPSLGRMTRLACLVKRKDIRKFLDGIYLSEKTTIVKDDL
jgi:hypothetical protein